MREYGQIAIKALQPYEKNARTHSEEQIEKIANSIKEFGFLNPVLIDGNNMIIAGHGRVLAAKKLKLKEVPYLRVEDLTPTQVRAYILADNKLAEEAGWDELLVSQELAALRDEDFNIELTGFEAPKLDDWFDRSDRDKDWDAREEGNDEYNEFLDKFEAKKTTDDCYTPPIVFDAIADWVAQEYKVEKAFFCRPFYPGGDYQNEKYKSGCVVVDNPPFSILAEILQFYCERGIKFFLFAPSLTLFSGRGLDICYLPAGAAVTYENGAVVSTSFITNMEPDLRIRTVPDLYKIIKEANDKNNKESKTTVPKYDYPSELVTAAILARYSVHGVEFTVSKDECERVQALDAMKDYDKSIFGGGFLLSRSATQRNIEAAKQKAENVRQSELERLKWELSERERKIVEKLDKGGGRNG
jgi:hypothetical protein